MNLRRAGLGGVLMTTMAVSAFSGAFFSVLATTLRAELGVARWQIGALVAISMGTGALLSPWLGAASDRFAPTQATAATLWVSALAFGVMSLAPGYVVLAGGAVIAGIAQALANPATNRLIMSQAEAGRRGLLTGVKQAGVQAGTFIGGILLPIGAASRLGWRGSAALVPLVSFTGLALLWMIFHRKGRPELARPTGVAPATSSAVRRISLYTAVLGLGTGSLMTYVPSYAEEQFGFSPVTAGTLVAVYGGMGLLTRLSAGSISERWLGHRRTLMVMAISTALAGAFLAGAPTSAFLWPAAVLIGIGPMAFNVIAHLSVMELSPVGLAGKGSGVVMFGFLSGVAIGAPLLGLSADMLGSYRYGWSTVAVLGLCATWIAARIPASQPAVIT